MPFKNSFFPFGSFDSPWLAQDDRLKMSKACGEQAKPLSNPAAVVRPNGDLSTHSNGIRSRRAGLGKNNSGFTLIEVLLALAIIGMVLTPILLIQQIVLRRSSSSANLFSRIIQAKDFLIDQQFENIQETQEVTAEKKITNPPTTLIFNSKKVPENSALKKFKHIKIDSVTMQWTADQNKKRQEKLVTFSFKPEEAKS